MFISVPDDSLILLTSLGIILLGSRLLAEFGRLIKLPIVMGEMIFGILVGPSFIGHFFPTFYSTIFPETGNAAIALNGIVQVSAVMLLFAAGLEVKLPMVFKQGRLALYTSFTSLVIPFAIGFWLSWIQPSMFQSKVPDQLLAFSLFVGTAFAITALPIIARILMDMNIYSTPLGMLIMASAMFNDLVGWLIFAAVLGMMENKIPDAGLGVTFISILVFGALMLSIGRKLINKCLPFLQTRLSSPGGVLAFSLGLCFLSAALTEALGVHAILGAFVMGIVLGDSPELNQKTREIIHQFVTPIFAPLFFVSIGLHVNFIEHFNPGLVLLVFLIASFGKIAGASLGAYMGGLNFRQAMTVGFGMNARGAMEILLGTIAYKAGVIQADLFVALLVMALATSLSSGPLMKLSLGLRNK